MLVATGCQPKIKIVGNEGPTPATLQVNALPAPELELPMDGDRLFWIELSFYWRWKYHLPTEGWRSRVKVWDEKGNLVLDEVTEEERLDWRPPKSGIYRWSVQVEGPAGKISLETPRWSFRYYYPFWVRPLPALTPTPTRMPVPPEYL